MTNIYNEKLIVSGNFIEWYKYEKKQVRGYNKEDLSSDKIKPGKRQKSVERSKFSLSRSRNNIKRLIYANEDLNKFLTLTYKENVIDLQKSNYVFKKFIQRLKRKKTMLKV